MTYVPAVFLDEAIIGFLLSFLLTPFSAIGYIVVFTIIAVEILSLCYYSVPACYPTRMFIIFVTVFGRFLGEVFWNFIAHKGQRSLIN